MPSTGASPSPWVLAGHPTSLGDPSALITLVDGQTFCLSSRTGDFDTNPTHGVFFADMRVLSRAHLLVGGSLVEPLAVDQPDARSATFIGRCHPADAPDTHLMVVRRRTISELWHEVIEVRNTSHTQATVHIELDVAADFADVFAVKEGREEPVGDHSTEVHEHGLLFRWEHGQIRRQAELRVSVDHEQVTSRGFQWVAVIPPAGMWSVQLDLAVAIGSTWIERHHHRPTLPNAESRNDEWLAHRPTLRTSDRRIADAYHRSVDDLAALRLHDTRGTHRAVIAAGVPWYMSLFGRDALITAYMALPIDTDLALGVLEALAELQGDAVDAATEEQPGRIVHETRYLGLDRVVLTGHSTYYGAVDATPLFVVLLGELLRWGLADADLQRLLPHADRALQWIDEYGDRDGDGYVEYLRMSDHGLVNQGWKDSTDAIRYFDGTVATAPLALCEVQGYVYAAYRARSAIARHLGNADDQRRWRRKATHLKERFNQDFWLEDKGWYAVALDADKRPVDSLTSNIGHCLWSGIVADQHAATVAERLVSGPMWSGWGIRTLAADEPGYDPMSYHCGTVWPHDNALCVAGLAHYGMKKEALQVANGLLDAAQTWDGRLPEFFCGLDRRDIEIPVPFPSSCSPQAWAAATPLLLLRVLLGMEPHPRHGLRLSPIPGAFSEPAVLHGVHCRDRVFDLQIGTSRARAVPRRPL
ncbi:MAG: hypothetical protein M9961_08980 [Ilumatobacteraceae bacterium]|nr:hypothetical protein [Ilumatobacter sp.]MCO5330197.1 hypothetical protein [Ilumatobacteraceae bacterium]